MLEQWQEIGMANLAERDPEVARAIQLEDERQRNSIVLIAAENYASKAVLEAQSGVMNNKYAEGYPGRRYYAGCQNVDLVERLATQRAKEIFGASHANVQPHSGSQANMTAYFGLLEPGDRVMGMQLDHGGHLTHGASVNFSGKLYQFTPYGVDRETETIDYDEVERLAVEHQPKVLVAGCSAYPRILDFPRFRSIADRVGALLMVDMAHIAGLVAGGIHPSPVPHAQVVTSTTQKSLRGPREDSSLQQMSWPARSTSLFSPSDREVPLCTPSPLKPCASAKPWHRISLNTQLKS